MSFAYVKSFNVWSDPDLGHRQKLKCFSPSKAVCFRHTRVMTQAARDGRGVGHALEELSQIFARQLVQKAHVKMVSVAVKVLNTCDFSLKCLYLGNIIRHGCYDRL